MYIKKLIEKLYDNESDLKSIYYKLKTIKIN
jgi:hypothetical protein